MKKALRIPLFIYTLLVGLLSTISYQLWRIHRLESQAATLNANYSLIEPGFYLGGAQSMPPDATAILNLSLYKDSYAAAAVQWRPVADGTVAPSLDWLRQQVQFIDDQRRAGRTVFVHCDAGVSRSGLVSAAYFMWRNHWGRDQALAYLRAARPQVNPNPVFMELLTKWQKALEAGG